MLVQAKLCLFHCSQFIRFSRKLFMLKVLWLLVMSEQLKAGQLSSPQSQIPSPQLLFPLVKFSQKCSLCDSKQRKKSWQLEVLTKKTCLNSFHDCIPSTHYFTKRIENCLIDFFIVCCQGFVQREGQGFPG